MSTGKAAAQAAHAAVAAALSAQGTAAFTAWLDDGQPKVVLRVASSQALDDVVSAAARDGLPVQTIADAGRTQLDPGTVTCCAVGPADSESIDVVTGALDLF